VRLRRFDPPACVEVGVVSQPQHLSPAARRLETMLRTYGVDDYTSLQSR
jgi:hypothetical protein